MSLPPADARAGAPRQTITSSPTPASTSSVATRWPRRERRLVNRVRPDDQQLRPLQARIAPRRPDLTDDAPEDHRVLQVVAVDDADDDVLVGDVGADGQIADAAAVRDQHAIAGAGRQAVDGDHQPVGLVCRPPSRGG